LAGSGGAKLLLLFGIAKLFQRKRINIAEEIVILPQNATSIFLSPTFLIHFVPKISCLATHYQNFGTIKTTCRVLSLS